jgi:N-acyl homoserine lactone hydrolase
MSISVVPTGTISSRAAFAFTGGSLFEERLFAVNAVLVHHPLGDLLIDAGFGPDATAHAPTVVRLTSKITRMRSVAEALTPSDLAALKGVVLTHAHWDHVSGLQDLPSVPVWICAAEKAFIKEGGDLTAVMRGFGELPLRLFDASAPFDLYGDGAIVLVPAPGHSPGSIHVFVTLPSGKRFVFIGDTAWQSDGLSAQKPWPVRAVVDFSPESVLGQLARLAKLKQETPDLIIVPAHEARAYTEIPVYPATLR